jgi:hypothetical protein
MLGSLPKLFDKNFVIGFYLPTLLALIGTAWAFPGLTVLDPVRSLAVSEKKLGDLTYLAVVVWVVSILLMSVNYIQYRLLEGYLPPVSWLLPLRWWHRWRFRRVTCRYDRLTRRWEEAKGKGQDFPLREKNRAADLLEFLVTHYPRTEAQIMPTSFGNKIRAFEAYPFEVYGADSIPVWPRLASVIPKDFAGLLDDARAQVDCFVTLTNLYSLIVLVSLAGAAYNADWLHLPIWNAQVFFDELCAFFGPAGVRHIVVAAIGLVVTAFVYWRATALAMAWGELVKSAFDCYLPALIKQLGFGMPPYEERREFWKEVNALILFERQMTANRWPPPAEAALKVEQAKPESKPEPAKRVESELSEEEPPAAVADRCRDAD